MGRICSVCLSSDILCGGCAKKMEKGLISEMDIAVSRALFKAGLDAEFIKVIDDKKHTLLIADSKNSGLIIGRGGRNAKKISQIMGKDVRVIEQVNDEKKLMEKIMSAPVLGINKIYGKSELYKVRMERRFKKRVEGLTPILSKAIGKEVKLVFE